MPKELQYGTTRKYSRVVLLSVLTFGIYYLFYQFWLFEDLEEHYQKAFTIEPRSYPTTNNSTTMLVFLLLFPIYPIYIKYTLLHDHLQTSNIKTESNCTFGINAVLTFLLLCICTVGIMPVIIENRWQKAFNEHILAHERIETKAG